MPTIHIYTIPRTDEQRRALAANLTQACVDALGVLPDHVRILIHHMPPECTANGGVLLSDVVRAKTGGTT